MPKQKNKEEVLPTYKTREELEIEERTGKTLSLRQLTFAERYAQGDISATRAAIEAGYSPKGATSTAWELLNPKMHPQVVEYIAYLREDASIRYGVTKERMLERLYDLSRGAEKQGQYSAAINAEKIRASLGGLTIDRRETINTVQDMTKDQVLQRLAELKRKHPYAFEAIEGEFTEVKNDGWTRSEPLEIDAQGLEAGGDEADEA